MKLGIFNSFNDQHLGYVAACKSLGVEFEIIDILSADWIELVQKSNCDGFLCSSTCDFQERKTILDERYYFVSQIMKRPIYPNYLGLFIHENKRNMAAWLEINGYSHSKTKVFTNKREACQFLETANYPLVMKSNIGAGASRVEIIKTKSKAKRNARYVFPIFKKLPFLNFGFLFFVKVKGIPVPDLAALQRNYLIVQEYKQVKHEWRILKIGNSYFGHQKLLKGNFASGSGLVGWVEPPKELLFLAKDICDKGGFYSMDVDIFETIDGKYYINELQTLFGSYLDYQMKVNDKPGRFLYKDGDFYFEEGEFNTNGSMTLRVQDFIDKLMK